MQGLNIRALYYITHIDNLPSILMTGILSHARIRAEGVRYTPIYNADIVNKRRGKKTPADKSLWHYANLFFQPRNAMLDGLVNPQYPENHGTRRNLAIVGVANTVLQEQGVFIADGLAANERTQFYSRSEGLEILQAQQDMLQSDSWTPWYHSDEIKRQLMAECLVPNQVNPRHIRKFIVSDENIVNILQGRLSSSNIQKRFVVSDIGSNIFTPFKKSLTLFKVFSISATNMEANR